MKTILWKEAQNLLENKPVTYLWFGTEWCGDCQMMLPVVESVEKHFENNSNVQFIKVDAEEAKLFRVPDSIYKVKKVPTHIFLKSGKIINILYEYIPEEIIIDQIKNLL